MKKQVLKNRLEFSTLYDCFSLKDSEYSEAYFSRNGCECCSQGACDVFEVTHLLREDVKNKNFKNVYTSELCGGCLSSMVNGDDSDLDFHYGVENE